MTTIHPTALISPRAHIGARVTIGPYCIIEDDTILGDGSTLAARVSIKSGTELGADNQVCEGAVLGGLPQHIRASPNVGRVRVGRGNVLRENVTIHRALEPGHWTVLGDENMLMVAVHLAHDCAVGSRTIMANNVMLAGHVEVGDRAYLAGGSAVHQFCRIGAYAMVGGYSRVNKDVPPFVTVDGETTRIVGLNVVGLRRGGFTSQQIAELKDAYRVIYRSGLTWHEVVAALRSRFATGPAAGFAEFLPATKRGITQERRRHGATLRLADFSDRDTGQNERGADRLAS